MAPTIDAVMKKQSPTSRKRDCLSVNRLRAGREGAAEKLSRARAASPCRRFKDIDGAWRAGGGVCVAHAVVSFSSLLRFSSSRAIDEKRGSLDPAQRL